MKLHRECSLPATSLHFGGEGRVSTFYAPTLDNRTETDKKWGYSRSFTLQTSVPKPLSSQPAHLSPAHQVWAPPRLLPFNPGSSSALGGLPRKAVPAQSQELSKHKVTLQGPTQVPGAVSGLPAPATREKYPEVSGDCCGWMLGRDAQVGSHPESTWKRWFPPRGSLLFN